MLVIGREDLGSWLEGPGRRRPEGQERAGSGRWPESGPGSVAGWGRRLGALVVDWVLAGVIAAVVTGGPADPTSGWVQLAVFAAEQLLLVGTLGFSVGHRVFGLRLVRVDGGWAGPVRVAVRTALLVVVIPAFVWDAEGRGMHDKAAGTVLLRW
ncbi:MAG: RDD family protein [Kineosporiaceae bacterium]